MTLELFLRLAGLLVAASYAAYGMEAIAPLHPLVRRAGQVTVCSLAALYALHLLGVVPL